jgi:hypothetical protein
MSINRGSLSDTMVSGHAATHRAVHHRVADPDTPRRAVMVVGGFVVALVSLAIGSVAIAQVWLAPSAVDGVGPATGLASWEALAMIVLGGFGFAAGAALVGIGMGHWSDPRTPQSDADYTGPGEAEDMPEPPRVV